MSLDSTKKSSLLFFVESTVQKLKILHFDIKQREAANFGHFCSIYDKNCCRFNQPVTFSINHLIISTLNNIIRKHNSSFFTLEEVVWENNPKSRSTHCFLPELSAVSNSLHQVGICSVIMEKDRATSMITEQIHLLKEIVW